MDPTPIPAGVLALGLAVIVALTACRAPETAGPDGVDGTSPPAADGDIGLADARARAVAVETAGCGAADATRGSGLALGGELVLTAAHVVASGGDVVVSGSGWRGPAELVAYDPGRDLALIVPATPLVDIPAEPERGSLAEGERGTIVGGATSGDVDAIVSQVLLIEMDDVRRPTRSTRRGYLTEAVTAPGDSGAGFYDDGGRLIGLLFAVSTTEEGRSWITASSEIDAFLAERANRGAFGCDPERSRVTRRP